MIFIKNIVFLLSCIVINKYSKNKMFKNFRKIVLTALVVNSILVSICYGQEEINTKDIIKKDNLAYKIGETEPFTGTEVAFFDNGNKFTQTPYVKGKIHGTEVIYYLNGNKFSETSFIFGKYNGKMTSYYDNGNIESEKYYINDYMNGGAVLWYRNGNKKSEGVFKDCHEDGLWIFYYENGKKEREGEFNLGKRNGKWSYWDTEGNLIETKYFENDLIKK
ncbi:MAG: hypothetical protein A2X12_08315 [Bacteroidetes bacterium GWE2_29_8]|nr:MAG: hypothetical protein A2X12_08315 [Bacteroidetes bacterium GWE2_29_8]OFY19141.1 MAG: hypothetical protein A2X02_00425 [Bacteroidetes bacterium GWF2_29_10]